MKTCWSSDIKVDGVLGTWLPRQQNPMKQHFLMLPYRTELRCYPWQTCWHVKVSHSPLTPGFPTCADSRWPQRDNGRCQHHMQQKCCPTPETLQTGFHVKIKGENEQESGRIKGYNKRRNGGMAASKSDGTCHLFNLFQRFYCGINVIVLFSLEVGRLFSALC